VKIEKPTHEFGILLDYSRFENDTAASVSKSNGNCNLCEGSWKHRVVQDPVLKFLECHCWVLSLVVQKIHQEKSHHPSPTSETLSHKMIDERTKCLEQLFRSKWVEALKPVFQNNIIVAALHSKPGMVELWSLLNSLVKKQEWHQCAEILWALPETELLDDPKLQKFHDIVMYEQASKLPDQGEVFSLHNKDECCMIELSLQNNIRMQIFSPAFLSLITVFLTLLTSVHLPLPSVETPLIVLIDLK
jgi:hypothetical protein